MPTHERSQFGCWTCRARKKKCDEAFPICSSCQTRGIQCYGYGPKPDWMDGSDKERKVLDDLKRVVKENLKQKRSHFTAPPQNVTPPSFQAYDTPTTARSSIPTPLDLVEPSQIWLSPNHLDTSVSSPPLPPDSHHGLSATGRDAKELETTLLMNYLDHVFPLQFNCYTPPVTELGRGWLLALLTRTKPLYHAALALSAFYMHSILQKTGRIKCSDIHWEEMKRHHSLAFKELQIQIAGLKDCRHLKSTIETLACIIQLISFELLRGGTDSWQIHLSAASSLVPTLATHLQSSPTHIPIQLPSSIGDDYSVNTSTAPRCIFENIDITADEPRRDIDGVACDFLVGTFIWFDIISSASTRNQPYLQNNEECLTTRGIGLDKIMGCRNWTMILISRISALARWKSEQQKAGRLSMKDLMARGLEIENALNEGLVRNKEDIGKPIIHPESASSQRLGVAPSKANLVLTRIFAFSALTYLHITISGAYPGLPEIQNSVSNTLEAFRFLPDPTFLRNLVWPFCITGCMASKKNEEFFNIAMKMATREGEGCPGNLWKAWDIVKECWRMREEQMEGGSGIDWFDTMENLGFQVLLV